MIDYMDEIIEEAFDKAKIHATSSQVELVASIISDAVKVNFTDYSPPIAHDPIVESLKKELEYEKSLIPCYGCSELINSNAIFQFEIFNNSFGHNDKVVLVCEDCCRARRIK